MSHAGFSGSSHLRASEYNTLKPDQVLSDVHALFRRMQAGINMVENATRTTAGAEFDTLEAWFVLDDPTPRCLKLLCLLGELDAGLRAALHDGRRIVTRHQTDGSRCTTQKSGRKQRRHSDNMFNPPNDTGSLNQINAMKGC
jgi:hypothetical protein